MSELTIYDKSSKYGDLRQGFAASAAVSKLVDTIDLRNPAVVKYARLLLGNSEAVRDSIDDIASYANKTDGKLMFKPDYDNLPEDVRVVISLVSDYARITAMADPVELAYVIAFLSAMRRGEPHLAMSLLLEFETRGYTDGLKTLVMLTNLLTRAIERMDKNDK